MIFRRSLVRELTATAIGLFVVLLAILFTQSVIRILARAAGGAVAADGVLALIGFNAMFYLNILLSVALFLTVLLTLSRWYRDSEMVVWFTSGQSLTACLKPILLFAAPFLVAIVAAVAVPVAVGGAAQARVRAAARVARRDLDPVARALPRIPARGHRRLRREHQPGRRPHPQRVPALGRRQEGRHNGGAPRPSRGRAQRRPLRRARGRPPLRGPARLGRIPPDRVRQARTAHRARRGARACPPRTRRCRPRRCWSPTSARERAELFWRISVPILALMLTLLAIPLAYVNPRMGRSFNLIAAAFLYMLYTNCINIVQSMIAQGTIDLWAGLLHSARHGARGRAAAVPPPALDHRPIRP